MGFRTITGTFIVLMLITALIIIPARVQITSIYQSEQGREAETTFAIEDAFETALINALEKEVDYNAKSRGLVQLKSPTNSEAQSNIKKSLDNDMGIYFEKYMKSDYAGTKSALFKPVTGTTAKVPARIEILEVKGANLASKSGFKEKDTDGMKVGMDDNYGRMTNYKGYNSGDVHQGQVWDFQNNGEFPKVKAKITYQFNSLFNDKTHKKRPEMTHTIEVQLDHANIIQRVWQ